MPSYIAYNGAMVTTSSYVPVATGVTGTLPTKTMLQIKAPANAPMIVWKWGLDFDGTGTTPFRCELVDTGIVGATVTAHVIAGIQPLGGIQVASQVQLGTAATGFTSTAEGTTTVTRYGSINSILPGNGDRNEWSLGREFYIPPGDIVRIRVTNTTATAANCACFICWDE